MNKIQVIPDSSFYICFIDDIKDHENLIEIIKYDKFNFIISVVVKDEIAKSPNYNKIEAVMKSDVEFFSEINYGEILRPLFSKEELKKGENEVITISFILFDLDYDINHNYLYIMLCSLQFDVICVLFQIVKGG